MHRFVSFRRAHFLLVPFIGVSQERPSRTVWSKVSIYLELVAERMVQLVFSKPTSSVSFALGE